MKLQQVRPAHIQALYAEMLAEGLASRTVVQHHRLLKQGLGHALQWQLLARNPAEAVQPPRAEVAEMRALTKPEAARLFETCDNPTLRACFQLAVATGFRRGEMLGLRWRDVAFLERTLMVARSVGYIGGQLSITAPKSKRSRRTIKFSEAVELLLREHRARQLEGRLQAGPSWEDNDLVFCQPDGSLIRPYTLSGAFRQVVRKAAVGPCRLHDLRHTAAIWMLVDGIPAKIVADRLGHASSAFTMDTYGHVLPDAQEDAASVVDAVLSFRTGR